MPLAPSRWTASVTVSIQATISGKDLIAALGCETSRTGPGDRLPRSMTVSPRSVSAPVSPAARNAEGPMSHPSLPVPCCTGTPIRMQGGVVIDEFSLTNPTRHSRRVRRNEQEILPESGYDITRLSDKIDTLVSHG